MQAVRFFRVFFSLLTLWLKSVRLCVSAGVYLLLMNMAFIWNSMFDFEIRNNVGWFDLRVCASVLSVVFNDADKLLRH